MQNDIYQEYGVLEPDKDEFWFDAIPDAEDGWFARDEERELELQAQDERRART
ncbi:hypothetical protein WMW72_00805 [Paenibacillus filicis]|uniref:Uncharacterized protein n=1 Tax=Paenibacillus filicis TaxID=669464 RepID=A0ABU9DC72_9BACL